MKIDIMRKIDFWIGIPICFVLSIIYTKTTSKISGKSRQKMYKIFQYLGAAIFILSGILVAIFNYLGKIEMNQMEGYSTSIRMIIFEISKRFQNPILDIGIFLLIVFIFYKLLKRSTGKPEEQATND